MNEWTVAIGVDTHKQWHVAVALDRLGRLIDSVSVEATAGGYRRLLVWARGLGEPAFGVEGCGSYGAGLARFLADRSEAVFECERPRRGDRRGGKNDVIDATLAARRVVSGEGLSLPRGAGRREQLRVLLLERRGAARARRAALNQLDAVIVTMPDDQRQRLGRVPKRQLVTTAARLRPSSDGASDVARRIAGRIQHLTSEIQDIDQQLASLVADLAPELLDECGVGAVCAAQLLVSSGDPRRMASEALLRRARRRHPNRRVQRQAATPPAQPRRRPPTQLGAARDRAPTRPPPRPDQGLLPAPTRQRQDHEGSQTLHQTRTRPPLLPPTPRTPTTSLDNIEASTAQHDPLTTRHGFAANLSRRPSRGQTPDRATGTSRGRAGAATGVTGVVHQVTWR